ncbi:MAG: Response regulator transcription factor [Patescibacteria group bacterium]|nr:hypothetical protein [Candidatus Saccharibacteria bacterium]MDQ5963763.1 Response regulator transcription factor [Patescibacteria group bacterium]
MNILLIEPDAILADMYGKALGVVGTVAWAPTAERAIQLADAKSPDVVVLEPRLARHNGVEFLYEFKSYPEWQSVPVLIHTSGAQLLLSDSTLGDLSICAQLDKHETSLQDLCSKVHAVGLL